MMVQAAEGLGQLRPGLASLLDLPLGFGRLSRSLRAGPPERDGSGSHFAVSV